VSLCIGLNSCRSQLTGLAAADGARLLTVGVLTDAESRTLLTRRLGAGRVAAEPAAAELTALCARLPLALTIAAARAAVRPDRPLAAVAAALHDERGRLDAFDTGEPASSARTVFFWSYRHLSAAAAEMFRLLGLHPGPDITVAAAASLAGIPAGQASRCLDELTAAHLAAEQAPGRFSFHDLLRAYAREQADRCDSAPSRQAAPGRMLDHYLHTAQGAAGLLCPGRDLLVLPPPGDGVQPEPHAGSAAALAWFIAERPVVSAAVRLAAGAGLDLPAWQLGWTLGRYLHRSGYWQEWLAIPRTALAAARHASDLAGQAYVHRDLGGVLTCLGSGPEADTHLRLALRLYQRLGRPGTGPGRPTPSATPAGAAACSASTRRRWPATSGRWTCAARSTTGTASASPGTAWATPTTASGGTTRRSPATGRVPGCSASSATSPSWPRR